MLPICRKYYFTISLILFSFLGLGNDALDKNILMQNLNAASTETKQLDALVALSDFFLKKKELDSAFVYLEQASLITEEMMSFDNTVQSLSLEKAHSLGSYHSTKGYYHFYIFERFKAIESFENAVVYFTKAQDNKNIADCINNLAVLYKSIGDLEHAILLNTRALEMFESIKDINGKLNVMFTLAVIYREQNDLNHSLTLSNEMLSIYRKNNDKSGEAKVLNLRAGLEKDLGDTTAAMANYANALAIYKDLKDMDGQANVMNNIGVLYKHWKEWDKAIEYFSAAHQATIQKQNLVGQAYALENLANVYFSMGEFDESLQSLSGAKEVADKVSLLDLNMRIAGLFFQIYEELENWSAALNWHKEYSEIKDSITTQQLTSKVDLENQRNEFERSKLLANKDAERHLAVYKERENRQRIK